MDTSYILKEKTDLFYEGIGSEHPDIKGQTDFGRRVDDILERRRKAREKRSSPQSKKEKNIINFFYKSKIRKEDLDLDESNDHEYSMARSELKTAFDAIQRLKKRLKGEGQLEAWVQSKITKATDYLRSASDYIESGESQVNEESMTKSDIKREKQLKKKYDSSGMKASMIKQYGPEKGKQVYFATIRKQAMESLELEEAYKNLPAKKMLNKAGKHNFFAGWVQGEWEGNRWNASRKKPMAMELVNRSNKRAEKIHDTVISHDPEKSKAKSKFKEEFELDEAKLPRSEKRAIAAAKKPKRSAVHAYDMDETLMGHDHSKVRVHVNDPSGKRVQSLTNQEFNTHKLPKDHSYDFGEFRSSKIFKQSAKPNKSIVKKLHKQVKQGKDVHIITARADMDSQPEFAQHLRRHGIEIDPQKGKKHVHVHRAGNLEGSDIGKKKVQILHGIMAKTGAKKGHMYDDAAKVHRAFQQANQQNPSGSQVKTHLVKPNKRGKVMSRSYQATKTEEFELWVNTLLDEGYDLSEFTVDELAEAYEELFNEAVTAIAAPAPGGGGKPPFKKITKKLIDFKSPYKKRPKKEFKEEVKDLTPYEFWKSFIGEEELNDNEEIIAEEVDETIEPIATSYDYWKTVIEESNNSSN